MTLTGKRLWRRSERRRPPLRGGAYASPSTELGEINGDRDGVRQ